MTVLNVLSTNSVAAGATEYQTVQTGYYRVVATAGDATIAFNDGPAITLIQDEALLLKGGKPGAARILKATNAATAVYTLGHNLGEVSNTHPFSSGDFIAVEDDSTSPAIGSDFLSAGTAGKKITALLAARLQLTWTHLVQVLFYTFAYSGTQALVQRAVKIAVTGQAVIVEEVQVVGG